MNRVSCPVFVYCDGLGCHVLCLYTVTDRVSCPVSVYYNELSVMSCVCVKAFRCGRMSGKEALLSMRTCTWINRKSRVLYPSP